MRIAVVGINHRTASVELREKLAIPEHELPDCLRTVCVDPEIAESALLVTCNRVELYAAIREGVDAFGKLSVVLARIRSLDIGSVSPSLYLHTDAEAVAHLFRVASGLDSMVLGETEVLGQVRHAYEMARSAGTTGRFLNALFQHALNAAKRVHTETAISRGRASVGSVAVEFACRVFGSLSERTALVIGAGEAASLTLESALEAGVRKVIVANRTVARAQELAEPHGGEAISLSELEAHLHRADIVISSTSAPHFILSPSQLEQALRRRRREPILVLDIAVPRDVDPAVAELDGVYLYDIDDLQAVVAETLRRREQEVPACEAIIEQEVLAFLAEVRSYDAGELISALNRSVEEIRRAELEWLLPKLTSVSEEDRKRIEQMAERLTRKILHSPIEVLRQHAAEDSHPSFFETVKRLFRI